MICFAIPDYGILFRCRTEGSLLDLEFSAFFSLLEFVKSKLKEENIRNVEIYSSNPTFVFSFSKNSASMPVGSARRQLLSQYLKAMKIAVSYVKPVANKALLSPAHYPSLPADQTVKLNLDPADLNRVEFKPFQTGVKVS
ncbi:MAG: hypothetical protein JSW34_08405 [Candidatus Zixiibacteriota bacterium]|nr:MAG: hypothetical protein JSW34_08405 [candidate division Zixibacteria bacterium]